MCSAKEGLMIMLGDLTEEARIVLAIHMPDGSTELIVNQSAIEKIKYIEKAYDDDLQLKANKEIYIINYMIY